MNYNNRNVYVIAAVLALIALATAVEASGMVIFILLALLFAVRRFDNQMLNSPLSRSADDEEDEDIYWEDEEIRQQTRPQSEPVYRHALEAVSRAGLNPDEVRVLAVDIGLIAYMPDGEQHVYRTWSLPDDVDYVQPFVQLRLPTKALGRVKFEILDSSGRPVFIHEDVHNLERGRNFISPSTRLPVHEELDLEGSWQMRVSADGVLLAVHQFEYAETTNEAIRRHLGEDGELNTELRAVMAESRLPKMSLDDLLQYQEEEDSARRRGSS